MQRPPQPAHISTLASLIAIGLTGFYVGVTNESVVMSFQGTAYLFSREEINTFEAAHEFAGKLFGLFNDPRIPAEAKAEMIAKLKPLVDEDKYAIVTMIEGPSRAFLFIPNEDIPAVLADAELVLDGEAQPVTLH